MRATLVIQQPLPSLRGQQPEGGRWGACPLSRGGGNTGGQRDNSDPLETKKLHTHLTTPGGGPRGGARGGGGVGLVRPAAENNEQPGHLQP